MSITTSLLPEFDHEMATTRRILERVPEAEFSWKPHEKSMTLGQLAGHVANLPFWCSTTLQTTELDLDSLGEQVTLAPPVSRGALLQDFDERVKTARAAMAQATDTEMLAVWTLKKSGHEIFSMPRVSAVRSFVMNHLIHHRGQLSVYLRLKDVPLPPIYGPTADEQ
jgi:uncharacterized damage-inducible protein DinB